MGRTHYWTCSKFADWLRGTAKPYAATSEGWRDWKINAKSKNPIRYWIADDGLDYLQTIVYYIPDKLYSFKYYINNRYITRTHALTAHPRDITPGTWNDVGNRFLPCLFNELVDYVEVELAWWNIAWASKEDRKKYNPPFWATGWFRVRSWRCKQSGLDNLAWQAALTYNLEEWGAESDLIGKPTPQAVAASEILALYKWWTEIRPARVDPHDESGWSAICAKRRQSDDIIWDDRTEEDRKESSIALEKCRQIEDRYENEDEDMLIRLIRIRKSLWT